MEPVPERSAFVADEAEGRKQDHCHRGYKCINREN